MAFHPDFANNGELYVAYTVPGDNRMSYVARYTSSNGGVSFSSNGEIIFSITQRSIFHGIGSVFFGDDGYLYISLGDNADSSTVQNTSSLYGKILRIDVDSGTPYGIPPDNPFASGGGAPEIYALGFRNPWRVTQDSGGTGEIWGGDVGAADWEEVDLITMGGNYGWPIKEGTNCQTPGCDSTGLTDPVYEYSHDNGCAVVGGHVYRGSLIPSLIGKYVFSDNCTGQISSIETTGQGAIVETLLDSGLSIRDFSEAPDGELLIISGNEPRPMRLIPDNSGGAPVDDFPSRLSETGCFDPSDPTQVEEGVIPYDVNAKLWSDGADKRRWLAIPDGTQIDVQPDGDWDFPAGSVLIKEFLWNGNPFETRLMVRHDDGGWAGYTYEWNASLTDADLVSVDGLSKQIEGQLNWMYPSRAQCLQCHSAAAGRSLGLETAQLNGPMLYPTGITANQLETLENIGMFSNGLGGAPAELPALTEVTDLSATLSERSRSHLHSNCANCHRPGGPGQGPMDFRFQTAYTGIGACNMAPENGDLGVPGASILTPGDASNSIMSLRMHSLGDDRMPPIGTELLDVDGTAAIDAWINSLKSCTHSLSPEIAQAFAADPIDNGDTTTIAFTLTNPNADGLTGAAFTNTYPAGMTNASPLVTGGTCLNVATSAVAGGASFDVIAGDVPAAGSCTITIDVTATATGTSSSSVLTTNEAPDSVSGSSATLTVNAGPPQPALQFSSSTESFSVTEGETTLQTATISLDTSDAGSISYSLSSSDPSWLTVSPLSGTTPEASITIMADPSGLVAGVYAGSITASAAGYRNDSIAVTLTVTGTSTGYQQDPATGLVAMEAENFDTNTPQGGHSWGLYLSSGASGGSSMASAPNTGTNNNTGYESSSPRLDYVVNFTQVGTHYVWIRGQGPASTDDSVHVGLNGAGQSTSDRITGFSRSWTWSDETMDGPRATIEVLAPGEQTLNVWMREDGVRIDKIVLTTDAGLVPTSFGQTGPAESPRGPPQPALQFNSSTESFSVTEGETTLQTATASLDTSDAGAIPYSLSSSDPTWLTVSPSSGTTPEVSITITADPSGLVAGVYSGSITASATGHLGDTIDVTLTVTGTSAGFQQDPATGLVAMEAENFDTNTAQGGHSWTLFPSGTASGGNGMEATPNNGTNNNTGFTSTSPRLDFLVNFTETGTHYIWLRGQGVTGSDDSVHVGLGGSAQSTSDRITGFTRDAWGWTDETMDGPRATINVSTTGEQIVNLWMREDGVRVDKIVLTTNASLQPGGSGPAESPRGPPQPSLEFDSESDFFTVDEGETALQTSTVSLAASDSQAVAYSLSSDETWLTTSPAGGTTPSGSITIEVDPSGLSAGQYTGTVTAAATGYIADTIGVTLTVTGTSTGYQQDPATGLVAMEAENFDTNTPQGGHSWGLYLSSGASGGSSMASAPNTGTNNNTGYESSSPRLDYVVNFTQVGTHYIWIRGQGPASTDDSVHVGLNGAGQSTSDRITGFSRSWTWSDETMDGPRATIEVLAPGEQTLNIWMREDGVRIDKIVLTTDAGLVPTSFGQTGPAESPRGPPQPALQFNSSTESFSVTEGETTLQTATVSLDTSDAQAIAYTIGSDAAWLMTSPTGGTTPAGSITIQANPAGLSAGQYTGTLTASAPGYLGDTIDVTLTVTGTSAGFQQDPATGLVAMEAENFDTNTAQGGHSWTLFPSGTASGGNGMEATPNNGTNNNTGYETSSPRLDYLVNFAQVGTHYVWVRGQGPVNTDDSLHVGLNGAGQSTSDRISGFSRTGWSWSNDTMDDVRATVEVTVPGEQMLNIWMREDGMRIDKIVLTTNASLQPGGSGPAESPRGPPTPSSKPSPPTPAPGSSGGGSFSLGGLLVLLAFAGYRRQRNNRARILQSQLS